MQKKEFIFYNLLIEFHWFKLKIFDEGDCFCWPLKSLLLKLNRVTRFHRNDKVFANVGYLYVENLGPTKHYFAFFWILDCHQYGHLLLLIKKF